MTVMKFSLLCMFIVILILTLYLLHVSLMKHIRHITCTHNEVIATPTVIQTYTDPIKTYDYNKLRDPLEEPTKRVDRYLLGDLEMRKLFNYPTHGYPDNPHWLGLLIAEDNVEKDNPNKIIKLFGRQKYPSSTQYDYYAMINVAYDQIKIHIHRKRELFDGDQVFIPELHMKFVVKLNKDDDYQYNPYF